MKCVCGVAGSHQPLLGISTTRLQVKELFKAGQRPSLPVFPHWIKFTETFTGLALVCDYNNDVEEEFIRISLES